MQPTTDHINQIIAFVQRQIATLDACIERNDDGSHMLAYNKQHRSHLADEIVELEELRDGHLTVEKLGTTGRFFNKMPAWATYGT